MHKGGGRWVGSNKLVELKKKSVIIGDFPSGPVAKTSCFQCQGLGSIPGQGTRSQMPQLKILNATTKTWQSQRVTIKGGGGETKQPRQGSYGRREHGYLKMKKMGWSAGSLILLNWSTRPAPGFQPQQRPLVSGRFFFQSDSHIQ